MNTRIFFALLLLISVQSSCFAGGYPGPEDGSQIVFVSPEGELLAAIYNSGVGINVTEALNHLMGGGPVVFYGNTSLPISGLYSPRLAIGNGSVTDSRLVASGLWLQPDGTETIEHQLQVYDSSFTKADMDSIYSWLNELMVITTPTDYVFEGVITEIDHHEPYGVLETRTEVLKVAESNDEYDWYDVSVTQRLTPGINYTTSSWEWNWLTYTMNGSLGTSNVYLSDYSPPPRNELPNGPFTFLWRILGFDLRSLIPWLMPPEPKVEGMDMSDYSLEVFRAKYQAPKAYRYKNEPMEIRHHYVLRIDEDSLPRFWQQTQVQYTQAEDFAQIPYITPPLASGYVAKLK